MRALEGKSIVIVGGTSGMGLSAAVACVGAGARVIVSGKPGSDLSEAAARLGASAILVEADAINPLSTPRLIEQCTATFGGFDALYHVAGGSGRRLGDGPVHQITDEGWAATIEWNLTTAFNSVRAGCEAFLKRKTAGSILLMGSVLGSHPSARFFSTHAYAAAKSGITGFARSCASYYAPHGIRVNVVAPGLVETPMAARAANDPVILDFIRTKQPLGGGRIGRADDLDAAVVWLLSDASQFVTGQQIVIDGGWSVSDGQIPTDM